MRTLFKIPSSILAFSLLFGAFFPPFSAKAGFLSSILGNEVSAEVAESLNSAQAPKNSQNMALLQVNTFSVPILQNPREKDKNEIESNSNINIISENALLPTVSHMAVPGEDGIGDSYSDQISIYVVRKGDSLSQIAQMFEVSVNTILWANDMKKGDKLKEGDILFILPISGVKHTVAKGETLKSIAKKYSADILDIASFNGITETAKLAIGEELIIPDGEISVDGPVKTNPTGNNQNYYPPTSVKNVAGYFINPVPSAVKTQGLHGKNAVDLAAPIGTPIYAAASGTVLLARTGWNGAYGNMVIIEHPNGTKTLYSHLSKLGSRTGQTVSQDEVIGYVGNTGRVRAFKGGNGAHLHFEVYGAKNPGADWSWKY